MANVLEFQNVSKRYLLGSFQGSLRHALPALARKLTGRASSEDRPELWALSDVSFQVGPGEAVAIIGPNGAGKTTALKLATFVTQPTTGEIHVHGRTSALIELGAGFHPDLTGRENIYLNGTILGMKRAEIQQRFDEIVAFSELERFLDTPVKRYSSGMYARLAFLVAAHVNPKVLIVDEVLAVGDVAFQTKCLAHMAGMKREGTTILLVSHAMPRLRRLCERGILLYRGQIIEDGPIDGVIETYQSTPKYSSNLRAKETPDAQAKEQPLATPNESPARITGVVFLDENQQPADTFLTGKKLIARIGFEAYQHIPSPVFEIWFHTADGTFLASHTTAWDEFNCPDIEGPGSIDLIIDPLPLVGGRFLFEVALTAADGISRYDWHTQRYWLRVKSENVAFGLSFLPHHWCWGETDDSGSPRSPD